MTTATTSSSSSSSNVYDAINKANAAASTGVNKLSDTQDRFLKLLTTQLKNQDPLNPLDNAQMTSQMAQISTVDGITKLNATLEKLISNSADSQTMQAAALVNHAVLIPGSTLSLNSNGAIAGVELASAADQVTVTIKDSNNMTVRTLQLGAMEAGSNSFQWDGKAEGDVAAAPGTYTFSVSAVQGGDAVDTTALSAGLVTSVERGSAGLTLNVGSMGSFKLSDVRQIL
jgi:flagellar basal-body rod modification protein FlgD